LLLLAAINFAVKSEKNEIKVEDASPAAHVEERDEDDALPQKPVSGTVVSEHLIKEGYSENSVNGSTSLSKYFSRLSTLLCSLL
jgi:hypothetical protein